MARPTYPGNRVVLGVQLPAATGTAPVVVDGAAFEVYADRACTVAVSDLVVAGAPVPVLTVDGILLPLFTCAEGDGRPLYLRPVGATGDGSPVFPASWPDPAAGGTGSSSTPAGVEHVQAAPAGSWPIPHTLGRRPVVAVYVEGVLVDTDVEASPDLVVVLFPEPTAGSAVLT